jgi:hypothetical protein
MNQPTVCPLNVLLCHWRSDNFFCAVPIEIALSRQILGSLPRTIPRYTSFCLE